MEPFLFLCRPPSHSTPHWTHWRGPITEIYGCKWWLPLILQQPPAGTTSSFALFTGREQRRPRRAASRRTLSRRRQIWRRLQASSDRIMSRKTQWVCHLIIKIQNIVWYFFFTFRKKLVKNTCIVSVIRCFWSEGTFEINNKSTETGLITKPIWWLWFTNVWAASDSQRLQGASRHWSAH